MKNIFTIVLLLGLTGLKAQVIIGDAVGTAPDKTSVLLEFAEGKNKGIIVPYVRTLPTTAVGGTILLDATAPTAARMKYFNGTVWKDLSGQNADITGVLSAQPVGVTETNSKAVIGASSSAADGALVLESTSKAMVLPIVADVQDIPSPSPGMMVYVNKAGKKRLAVFNGRKWSFWEATAATPIPVVTSLTGKIWMDRNLGATQVATSSSDAASFGDLYQWGRLTDGHEKRNSLTTTVMSTSDVPGNGFFIIHANGIPDWRSPSNDNLWQGVNGINNPCPTGFRLPTLLEWTEEKATWTQQNAAGALASPLKLPVASYRDFVDGSITAGFGVYWSSTALSAPSHAYYLLFDNFQLFTYPINRDYGMSVRCIKN